jgi:uncharacterized protein with PhoU and TrkA domain
MEVQTEPRLVSELLVEYRRTSSLGLAYTYTNSRLELDN